MNHLNQDYLESLYAQFKILPDSVGIEWKRFFEGVELSKDLSTTGAGVSEKELHVYNLISAYRNYGHFEADLDPLTNMPSPSDQLHLTKFNLSEKDLENLSAAEIMEVNVPTGIPLVYELDPNLKVIQKKYLE